MIIEFYYTNTRGSDKYTSSFGKKVMSKLEGSYNYEKLYGNECYL